jgi:hypothetical protein
MKKTLSLLFTILSLLIFTIPASATRASNVIITDYTETKRTLSVYDATETNGLARTANGYAPYVYTKTCEDWHGCPYQLKGEVNGKPYFVYRQHFTNRNSDAHYSGWLYF